MSRPSTALEGPLDLPTTLEVLRRWGDDRLDRWDGVIVRRTVVIDGEVVAWGGVPRGTVGQPSLEVHTEDPRQLGAAIGAARSLVITAPAALRRLATADPLIARLYARWPGVGQLRYPDLLTALVRAISAQQVNLRWAATTRARLALLCGRRHRVAAGEVWSLDAARLAATSVADIRALQFTTRKAEYLIGVGEAVATGRLEVAELARLPDAEVVARLTAVRGIGRWSAEWVLARTLGRPVVVAGDLGVRRVVAAAYGDGRPVDEATVRQLTAHWGEAATVAQSLLLHAAAADGDGVAGRPEALEATAAP